MLLLQWLLLLGRTRGSSQEALEDVLAWHMDRVEEYASLLKQRKAPLVFFDQRSTGGSKIRQSLSESDARVCYDQEECDDKVDVMAGHLSWTKVAARLRNEEFECLTVVRQPRSRREACLDYGSSSESCSDEPLRIFWDEGLSGKKDRGNALNVTLSRLSKCVVGVYERCEESRQNLRTRFPSYFVDELSFFPCHKKLSSDSSAAGEEEVLEQAVYDFANVLLDAQSTKKQTSSVECHGRTVKLRTCRYRNVCIDHGEVVYYAGGGDQPLDKSHYGVRLRNVNAQHYKGDYSENQKEVETSWIPNKVMRDVTRLPSRAHGSAVFYDFAFPAIWGHVLIDDFVAAHETVTTTDPTIDLDTLDLLLARPCRRAPAVTETEKLHGAASCRLSYSILSKLLTPQPVRVVGEMKSETPRCYANLYVGTAGRAPALGNWALLQDSRSHAPSVRAFFDRALARLDLLSPTPKVHAKATVACLLSRSRRAVSNLRDLCQKLADDYDRDLVVIHFPKFVSGPKSDQEDAFEDDEGKPFDLLANLQAASRADVVVTPHGSLAFNAFFCREPRCLVFSIGDERETPLVTSMPWLFHVNHPPDRKRGDAYVDTAVDGVKALTLNVTRAAVAFKAAFDARARGVISSY